MCDNCDIGKYLIYEFSDEGEGDDGEKFQFLVDEDDFGDNSVRDEENDI